MGGGKSRRHTAKTGDKSLYSNSSKQRAVTQSQIVERHESNNRHNNSNNTNNADAYIYDPVDQFHNQEYLRLDHDMDDDDDNDDDESDDGMAEEEVMRLDVDDDADDDSQDDEEEEDEDEDEEDEDDEEDEPIVSSDDEGEDDENNNDVRDWGMKKTTYYYGDTADLEIGQEVEEALLEEDAAKDVLQARYQDMTEDDFMMDGDEPNQNILHDTLQNSVDQTATTTSAVNMSLSRLLQLSSQEKRQLLHQKHHNEFIPLLSYFAQKMIVPYTTTTLKATNAIFYNDPKESDEKETVENTAKEIGATKLGQQYLLTKAMMQSSAALNFVMYLLLKAEQAANAGTNMVDAALIQSHPVMQHLEKLNSLYSKLEDGVEQNVHGLTEQLETLAKAADYVNDPTSILHDSEDSDSGSGDENDADEMDDEMVGSKDVGSSKLLPDNVSTSDSDDDDDDAVSLVDDNIARRLTLNEARFGLRPNEMQNIGPTKTGQRRNNMMPSDAGDDDDVDDDVQRKKNGQSLATTLNTIEQRISTDHKRSKRSSQQLVEHIDDPNGDDNDGELRRGLAMMDEALGAPSDGDDDDDDDEKNEQYDPELNDHDEYDNGSDDFYSKMLNKSKATKEERKQRYAVAPKFPRVENDIVGDRTASKQILKNRGLVAHKAKINRNPRVKHREKFRKANIRRSGTVQAIRSPSEGDRYGGEATGISTNVVRSRKLI